MSFVPYMQYSARKSTQQIVTFGGLRYGRGGNDGDFSQTRNLSSRQFPALSQRRGRKLFQSYDHATALYARNKLIVVDGTDVIYDGRVVGQVTEGEKSITSVNTKVLIFPDKKYYDTELDQFGDMAVTVEADSAAVTWTTSSLKITGKGDLQTLFAAGQAVEISGSSVGANNKTAVIRGVSSDTLTFSDNTFSAGSETGTVKVERKVPDQRQKERDELLMLVAQWKWMQ